LVKFDRWHSQSTKQAQTISVTMFWTGGFSVAYHIALCAGVSFSLAGKGKKDRQAHDA
jgi:hypothetical protein